MRQLVVDEQADRSSAVPHRATGHDQQPAAMAKSQVGICKTVTSLLSLLICGLLLSAGAFAQEFRATISGTVVDPSGAVVPGASIVVLETRTGTINRTTSDSVGQYVVPFLLPGNYSITVTKAGFQALTRSGIVLQAQEHPMINLALTLGSESRTVTVTSAAPLLNQANGSIGDVIPAESVASLPINGYSPPLLAELSVGVHPTSQPEQVPAYSPGTLNSWSIGGTHANDSEILLDGAADTQMSGGANGGAAFVPTEDTVQEVAVQVFSTDASIGHSLGGAIDQVTKGGTNQLHGSAYEFTQPTNMTANLYFNGRTTPVTPIPIAHYNQYGLTAGGPIWIPKVFNGKNKLFFFFAWERINALTPATTIVTVPTDAEKEGDFSALLAGGSSYQLYEPNTGTLSGGAFTRTPVPNNCLTNKSSHCASLANAGITIDPIAAAYLKLYPEPNTTSGVSPITNQNNYNSNAPSYQRYSTEFGRLDYNLSARDHMFFDFRHNQSVNGGNDLFGNHSTENVLFRGNDGAVLDNVFTMNPTTVFDVRLNWNNFLEVHSSPANMYSPTSVGFPASMVSASNLVTLPNISFNSSSIYGEGDSKTQSLDPSNVYQIFINMTKSVGRHTLKIGFDGRTYRQKIQTFTSSSGSFTFGNSFVTCGTSCSAQPFGGDLASFEYGLPTSGSFGINALGDYRGDYIGSFVQDDWRVNKHLTLNLGIRFDIDTPYGEKFGRTESGFNPSAVNSASAAATAFIPTTVTKNNTTVTVSSINALGGLTFPSSDWGAPYQIQNKTGFWSPRVGFSYSPAWLNKTVVRGGFGAFVLPQSLQGNSYSAGFSATTSYQATNNNYFTNLSTLDNPFPSGFVRPAGASLGANTYLGSPSTISYFDPVEHDEYSERWTLDVQQALTGTTLVEVIYEGNHAVHLPVSSRNINATELQYLTTNPYRDQNLATALSTAVANPFAGLLPNGNSSYNGATTSLSNLLVPFPAFGSASINEEQLTNGQSFYESGMVHVEQRAQHGLTLTANYNFSKMIEQDVYNNSEDTKLYRGISPNEDYRHHFTIGGVYELPFGRGKLFSLGGGKLADEIAGGWVLNGIYQFQTGLPINFGSDIPFQPGMSVSNIHSQPRNTSPAGSGNPALTNAPSVFVTGTGTSCTVSGSQPCDGTVFFNGQYSNHYRTLPRTFDNVRADGWNQLDSSMLKNFHFSEKAYLQFRFETFNTLNHPFFSAPSTSATSSSFGYITGETATPRVVQLGARIVF